jgi:hypothetical protein
MYTNADIVYFDDVIQTMLFAHTSTKTANKSVVMVGKRMDVWLNSSDTSMQDLSDREIVKSESHLNAATASKPADDNSMNAQIRYWLDTSKPGWAQVGHSQKHDPC